MISSNWENSLKFGIVHFLCFSFLKISTDEFFKSNFFAARKKQSDKEKSRVLIVGAGNAGEQIIKQSKTYGGRYDSVAIVDDSPSKKERDIQGIKIVGKVADIPKVAEEYKIDLALIAIPSAKDSEISYITQSCLKSGISVKTLPNSSHVLNNTVSLGQFREIQIEDLLARNSISLETDSITDYIKEKTLLVTGAGGSIGSEICFQACKLGCQEIILVDNNEYGLYKIDLSVRENFPDTKVHSMIGDVKDFQQIKNIFEKTKPHIIFHAAAYKHVPLMEENPVDAIKTNVLGTKNVLNCSIQFSAHQFILVSTDKAVNPTNVMGTTKRIAEIVVQMTDHKSTRCNIVRFGNVLNSRGSAIPRFIEQIKKGGPVTLTHKDITRFFMSIPEAAQLLLKTASFERKNEIFILDMGRAIKIYDLVLNLIRLHGLIPEKDIKVKVTGLRPGEKLFEELLADKETTTKTPHPKIRTAMIAEEEIEIKTIDELLNYDWNTPKDKLIHKLKEIVPEFVSKL